MVELTAVSLFAGVGGIDLALERAGIRVVAAVELEDDCRSVLRRHFPGVRLFKDVREVTGDDLRAAGFVPGRGLVAAGWPCQGNSVAGRRGGLGDPRSGLWRHVVRLLAETSSRWFLGENVPGLLSVNGGADIAVVRSDLAQLGYWWAERILDAQHFGVPQRRKRVFFVGHLGGTGAEPVQVLLEPEGGGRDHPARCTAGTVPAGTAAVSTIQAVSSGRGYRIDAEGAAGGHLIPFDTAQITSRENRANPQAGDPASAGPLPSRLVSHALTSREGKGPDSDATSGNLVIAHALTSAGADASEDGTGRGTPLVPYARPVPSSLAVAGDFSTGEDIAQAIRAAHGQPGVDDTGLAVRRLTPLETERLQGLPDDWTRWGTSESGELVPQSDAARYRQVGNSVAVPVLQWIAARIAAAETRAEEGAA